MTNYFLSDKQLAKMLGGPGWQDTTDFLSNKQLAEMLGVTTRTTLRWRHDGEGPRYVRAGLKRVLYRRSDVLAWVDARTFPTRAAEGHK